ncbi:DapH/DapD/GlmU-related protein [Ideonella sp. BYS139W]|jgi:acetyltransferase-like isoleucine patch superfamily enzyme|uniref:DapH/DapD/GlmU-related protein n=1 Tax=Pseudaquabacterium rugosum TaxID=2984194 RepID=A0ABU9B445_9BURK
MQANWKDYLLIALVLTPVCAVALGLAAALDLGLRAWLGPWSVAVAIVGFLSAWALGSALALQVLRRLAPVPPGEHAQTSREFARWKALTVVYRLGQGALSPLLPFFLAPWLSRLYGARMGADVAVGGHIDDPYAVSVGAGTVIGNQALVSANALQDGRLLVAPVVIGRGVTIGANAIVMPGVTIGDGALIAAGACVMAHTQVPAGEQWRGNPARKWVALGAVGRAPAAIGTD